MSLPKCGAMFANGMPDPAHVHSCIVELPCPGNDAPAPGAAPAVHACECGQRWSGRLGEQAHLEPQEPAGGPEVPPGVQEVLEAAGAALGGALAPLVAMVAERDEVIARMTYALVGLQGHLAAVLPLARPTWAADLRIVEEATAALAALTPKDDDAEADRPS